MRLYWHDIKHYYVDLFFSVEVFEVTEAEYAIVERIRCISFEGEGVGGSCGALTRTDLELG